MSHRMISMVMATIATMLLASGCGAFRVRPEGAFEPAPRYGASPLRVRIVVDGKGEAYLTDDEDNRINRPWKIVATYMQLPSMFTSWPGAARQLGCDAYWITADVTQHYTFTTTATIRGVEIGPGDQVCIRFDDEQANQDRASEGTWMWTAYQRPPMNAGWSLNGNWHVAGAGTPKDTDMSLEKWFRGIPLGLGVRAMTQQDAHKRTWASVGGQAMVPVIAVWKMQVAGLFSVHKGFADSAIASDPVKETLRIGYGALVDVVFARWAMIGVGWETWHSLDARSAPDGGQALARYGFAF